MHVAKILTGGGGGKKKTQKLLQNSKLEKNKQHHYEEQEKVRLRKDKKQEVILKGFSLVTKKGVGVHPIAERAVEIGVRTQGKIT